MIVRAICAQLTANEMRLQRDVWIVAQRNGISQMNGYVVQVCRELLKNEIR